MNTIIDTYDCTRYATPEEIAIYDKIEEQLQHISDGFFDVIITACSNHAFFGGDKSTYSRVYRLAKKLNTTVDNLMTWYYILD